MANTNREIAAFGPRDFSPNVIPPLTTKGFPLSPHGDSEPETVQEMESTAGDEILPLAARYASAISSGRATTLDPVMATGTLNNYMTEKDGHGHKEYVVDRRSDVD